MAINFPLTDNDVSRVVVADGSTNNTVTFNKPANVANGELMLLRLSSNDILNPNSISISGGSYWTLIDSNYSTNGNWNIHIARYWARWHAGDDTEWTATIGASDLDDESFVQRVTGAHATTPIGAKATAFTDGNSNSPVSPSLTTTQPNSAVIFDIGARNGNNLTTEGVGAPAGTTLIYSKKTRPFSSGLICASAYEIRPSTGATGTRPWSGYLNNGAVWSGFAFEILPAPPSQTINSVNGGTNTVKWGQACTWSTNGFTTAVSSATLAGVVCSGVSGSGFTAPTLVDEATMPMLGTRILLGSNTVPESANISVTVQASGDLRDVTLAGTLNTTDTGVLHNFSPAAKAGDLILWPTEVDGLGDPLPEIEQTIIDAQGNISPAFFTGTRVFWHISVDDENANIGVARSYTVTLGENGSIIFLKRGRLSKTLNNYLAKNINQGVL